VAVIRLRVLLVALAVATAVGGPAAPAGAHGGAAVFEVLEVAEATSGRVVLRVRVTHEADGEPAEGAIVEVAATGPDGEVVPAEPAERQDQPGAYAVTLDLAAPGAWTLQVSSSFPPGTTEIPVEIPLVDGGAADASTVVGPSPPTSLTAVLDEPEAGGAEGGSDTTNLLVAAVFGIVGGALGLWVSKRRSARRRKP